MSETEAQDSAGVICTCNRQPSRKHRAFCPLSTGRTVAERVHEKAHHAAMRDLRDLYPEAYRLLVDGWVDHFKKELGYADRRGRPANAPTTRGPDGKFVSEVSKTGEVEV